MIILFLILLLIGFLFPPGVRADFRKVDYPNNKTGIHLAIPSYEDLEKAARLVNSSGGDWGYVTLVIEQHDRDFQKWQDIFDRMRLDTLFEIEENK